MSQSSIDISGFLAEQREDVNSIRIRAFQASRDMISCIRFQEGHLDVLRSFGFKVSSTQEDWMLSESVYVILVESQDSSKVYGGARIEICNSGRKVPIQTALSELAPEIEDFVLQQKERNVGELCGLWNSVAVAGLGIGSVYSIRAAIALSCMLKLDGVIALCSVHSYKMASTFGFSLLNSVGNSGIVYYEGARQNAHITYQDNLSEFKGVDQFEIEKIKALIEQPMQTVWEERNGNKMQINYELEI